MLVCSRDAVARSEEFAVIGRSTLHGLNSRELIVLAIAAFVIAGTLAMRLLRPR
jgi:hypothetical protein